MLAPASNSTKRPPHLNLRQCRKPNQVKPTRETLIKSLTIRSNFAQALFASLLLGLWPFNSSDAQPSEYETKAAYLYNFTKFITWPDGTFASNNANLILCVLGDAKLNKLLDPISQRKTHGRDLTVYYLAWFNPKSNCHILFVTKSSQQPWQQIFATLKNKPVLTIGETPDFALNEGIIEFSQGQNQKVNLKINLQAAKRQHLHISAQLLEVASLIYNSGGQGL